MITNPEMLIDSSMAGKPAYSAGPLISEVEWQSRRLARVRGHVALVAIHPSGDHLVIWPHQRGRTGRSWRSSTVYEVDLGLHCEVLITQLPSRDYSGAFRATFGVYWRVLDPAAAVRHHVRDIVDTLTAMLQLRARAIARGFSIEHLHAAEDELNAQLGGVHLDVASPVGFYDALEEALVRGCLGADYGLWTHVVTELELDETASAHLTKMKALSWAIEEEEAEQRLRMIRNRNEQEVTKARIDIYREIIAAGDLERFALRLARNPEDIDAIIEIFRQDQLASRKDTVDFIKHMVDRGVVERWEVSDQVREALNWLKEATARVVNREHPPSEYGQPWRQHRRGREDPVAEPPTPSAPPQLLVVQAEEAEDLGAVEPETGQAEPGEPAG